MSQHILVFDSGLGGTTILAELQKQLPTCSYSYAMDNAVFPYGGQSDAFLLHRCLPLFSQLITADQPDLVVIACNTASTLFLDQLRQHYPDLPFVGVVPAIKPAATISKTGVIALLATPATIRREYIDALATAHACHCELIRYSHPDLVMLAEQKIRSGQLDLQRLDHIMTDLKQHPQAMAIDTFVLGCTHFPAIRDELAQCWMQPVQWVDSGVAIARRVSSLLPAPPLPKHSRRHSTLYLTGENDQPVVQQSLQSLLPDAVSRVCSVAR